jgi:hypothetical protein
VEEQAYTLSVPVARIVGVFCVIVFVSKQPWHFQQVVLWLDLVLKRLRRTFGKNA